MVHKEKPHSVPDSLPRQTPDLHTSPCTWLGLSAQVPFPRNRSRKWEQETRKQETEAGKKCPEPLHGVGRGVAEELGTRQHYSVLKCFLTWTHKAEQGDLQGAPEAPICFIRVGIRQGMVQKSSSQQGLHNFERASTCGTESKMASL